MQEELIRRSARALFSATWVAVVPSAFALSLGDVEVRSALGDVLDARVPLALAPGEVVDATCFALARDPEPGIPVLTEGLLTVERLADQTVLRIRSSRGVFEPAMRLRVRAGCPGQAGEMLRQYSVLLDPRRGEPLPVNAPAVAIDGANAAATAPASAATLQARPGDTLQGLATKVFPGNRAARDVYLKAMRAANPALASLADNDTIPAGAAVALPDLRTFASQAAARTIVAAARAEPRKAAPARHPRARHKSNATTIAKTRPPPEPPESPEVAASPRASSGGFVLKLSGNDLDVARSRTVDDRTRAQLRERLMVLESDDQVAAVLALRNRLSQLEARVNELQLKLAQMPSSFPSRPAEASKPEPASTPAETKEAVAATPEPPKAETAKPAPNSDAPAEAASKATVKTAAPVKAVANAAKPAPSFDLSRLWQSYGLWAAFIAVLALLMLLVWRLTHRGDGEYESAEWEEAPPPEEAHVEPAGGENAPHDATLALESPDAGALRRRYIEERFPEVMTGALALDDPASVVKGARLLYEDGALPRAVELLQFAIEENPMEARPWLALFEIFRLERLSGEFAELARRFYEQHGNTEYWRKIRYFGREIDPGNFLYREDVDALETIPPGARAKAGDRFDPARENWLGAPMDFDNEVLANELRQALMANAGVVDQDLVPNPMPALRDAEMFTVA